jgi:hypothetical protein
MSIDALKDTIAALARSLRLANIVPAGLLVWVNACVLVPLVAPNVDVTSFTIITLMIFLTLTISYMLYVFNYDLIEIVRGKHDILEKSDVGRWLQENTLREKQTQFQELLSQIKTLRKKRVRFLNRLGFNPDKDSTHSLTDDESRDWELLSSQLPEIEHKLDLYYPSTFHAVLPTRIGNTITAFQDYPRTRYGMDWIALWPRLIPVLKDNDYMDLLDKDKDAFDFLLNTCLVIILLGVEIVYMELFLGNLLHSFLIGFITLLISSVLYNGALAAAYRWGMAVRVAFDLYRHDLSLQLGLHPAETFEEEYERWQQVSRFLLYRRKGTWFKGFLPQTKIVSRRQKERGEGEEEG